MPMVSYVSCPVLTAIGNVTYAKSPITNMMLIGPSKTQCNNIDGLSAKLECTNIDIKPK